ncbi:MAG: Ig-like domain-containing protein [Bacilli bacterium]|nr:Ig-like domain-containing protein [Bacilli bacterium]
MYTDYIEENEEDYYADDDNNSSSSFDNDKLKKIAFFVLVFVVLIILIVLLAKSCSKTNNNPQNNNANQAVSVYLSKPELSLKVGEESQLYVDAWDSNSTPLQGSTTWSVDDENIATVSEGIVQGVSEGETKVYVQFRENITGNIYRKECYITVTSNAPQIESLSLGQEEISIKEGGSLLLQLNVTPSGARTDNIVFESESTDIVTVDQTGYVRAVAVGTTSVIAKTSDESVSTSIVVHVTETGGIEINPTSLKLAGLANGIKVGTSAEIIYNVLPDNATYTLTWASSDPSIATVENGVVTGRKAGTCEIIATTPNGISDKLTVTVESDSVPVESINITGETSITMKLGGTKLLRYSVLPENATNKNVTYTTSNSSIVFIDSGGVIAAVGVGSCYITITSEDGSKTAVLNITVTGTGAATATSFEGETGTSTGTSGDTTGIDTGTGGSSSTTGSGDYYTSGSGDTSYTVGSGDSSSGSCSVNSFIVQSNQSNAKTSNYNFENAKAFTLKSPAPGLTVTSYDSCIKTAKYSMWYSKDKSKLNTSGTGNAVNNKNLPKLNGTISLGEGDGYYYIKATITSTDGNTYSKYYYAIVNNGGSTGTILVTNTSSDGNTFKITSLDSNIKYVAYCTTINSSCTPKMSYSTSNSYYYNYRSIGSGTEIKTSYSSSQAYYSNSKYYGVKVCFRGANSSKVLTGDAQCRVINNASSSTTTTSSTKITITRTSSTPSTTGSKSAGNLVSTCKYNVTKTSNITQVRHAYSYTSTSDCARKLSSSYDKVTIGTNPYSYYQKNAGGSSTAYMCFAGYNSSGTMITGITYKSISGTYCS